MDKDLEFYLNNPQSTCVIVPQKDEDYLRRKRYLSEYTTEDEKQTVRDNLGITKELGDLHDLYSLGVIERGNLAWDLQPTQGHTQHILSSDSLYKVLQKYALKTQMEAAVQRIWTELLTIIDEKVANFQAILEDYLDKTDKTIEGLREIVNNQEDSLRHMIDTLMCEYSNTFEEKFKEIEKQLSTIKSLATSKSKNGVAVSDKFGDSENISISQKTLTEAINNVYKALSDITGRPDNNRIQIIITPDKLVTENDGQATISVRALDDIFEKLRIYVNGKLIVEEENVRLNSYQTTLTDTSIIRVEAYILGKLYTEEKTIPKCYPLFVGSGSDWLSILDTEYVREIGTNLTGVYNLHIKETGDKIFVVVPISQKNNIQRIHMNGYDIPFDIIETDEYVIYSSKNTYRSEDCVIGIQAN